MRTNHCSFYLLFGIFLFATSAFAQTVNFDETWKEFLENNKISNMSQLVKPDKVYKKQDYAKYLLMNTNTNFCQSDIADAEKLMDEIQAMDGVVYETIPGYIKKMEDLNTKMKAYHAVDAIWQRFLTTKQVPLAELHAVESANSLCEKATLAKYSYMTAYANFCKGDMAAARNMIETRLLRLTEKTNLRVEDVQGLAAEVSRIKTLFVDMSELDKAWANYVRTGVSRGFAKDLPAFECNPNPTIKVLILRGAVDICEAAPVMLAEIKKLQASSPVAPDKELAAEIKKLEQAVAEDDNDLAALNAAWEAFIPDNVNRNVGRYGYDYCEKEPLIRAYIMDGFAYVCEMADEMLDKIDELQRQEMTPLEQITMIKINELAALSEQNQADGIEIDRVYNQFVAQGDKLTRDYASAEFYCDRIHQVKDWTIRGLTGTCEEGNINLENIEAFQSTFEFKFTDDLECRIQRLRIKVWDCRHDGLQKLAQLEAPDAAETRLQELMDEYGMTERPELCDLEK